MSDVSAPAPSNYDNAVDTLAASQVMRELAAKLHEDRRPGERDPRIGHAEATAKEGVQRAIVHSNLAVADQLDDLEHTLALGLDSIATHLGSLLDAITSGFSVETLESTPALMSAPDDVECARCGGPIARSTADAFGGMCEACSEYAVTKGEERA